MKAIVIGLIGCAMLHIGCGSVKGRLQNQSENKPVNYKTDSSEIDKDAAIRIAKENAAKRFPSLEGYNLVPCEQVSFWRVFLEPKNSSSIQQGIEYVISKRSGVIIGQHELRLAGGSGDNENLSYKSPVNKEDAVAIAKKDGVKAYDSLVGYDLIVCELDKVWIIAFSPKEGMDGGGPEYVIDKGTGKILDRRYFQ